MKSNGFSCILYSVVLIRFFIWGCLLSAVPFQGAFYLWCLFSRVPFICSGFFQGCLFFGITHSWYGLPLQEVMYNVLALPRFQNFITQRKKSSGTTENWTQFLQSMNLVAYQWATSTSRLNGQLKPFRCLLPSGEPKPTKTAVSLFFHSFIFKANDWTQ